MTDKNRQKGNESVGEKSDGLAGDAREAFRNAERDAYLMMMLRKHISPVAVDYVSLGDVPTEGMKRFARGLQNDARTQGFEDCINAIRGAIAFGQQNANVPPAGNWLTEFWEIGQKLARPAPEALGAAKGVSEADLIALLPGTYYMDPPDGGSVTLLEQLQRMAKDAARFRWLNSQRSEVWHEFADVPMNRTGELIDIDIAKDQS